MPLRIWNHKLYITLYRIYFLVPKKKRYWKKFTLLELPIKVSPVSSMEHSMMRAASRTNVTGRTDVSQTFVVEFSLQPWRCRVDLNAGSGLSMLPNQKCRIVRNFVWSRQRNGTENIRAGNCNGNWSKYGVADRCSYHCVVDGRLFPLVREKCKEVYGAGRSSFSFAWRAK